MNNIIKAWKKLGKKLTGQDITGTNLVNVIDDIADNYEGGSGGNDQLIVNFATTYPEGGGVVQVADKTYDEIMAAINNGTQVIGIYNTGGIGKYYAFLNRPAQSPDKIEFLSYVRYGYDDTQFLQIYWITISSDNTVTNVIYDVAARTNS